MKIPIWPSKPVMLFVKIAGQRGTREILSMLDTGASFVVISTEDAIGIGYDLSAAPRSRVVTASGVVEPPRIMLRRVSVGQLYTEDVPAICYDIPGGEISALLGLSFLERFKISLDYKTSTMEIVDP